MVCLMALDFAREKEIDLASNFPYDRLDHDDDCLVSSEY